MSEHIAQIVVALIGAAGLVAAAAVGAVKSRRANARKQPQRAVFDMVRVYDVLNELRHDADARRVAVVRTHNGGGIPSARVPLYSTALAEVTDGADTLRDRWKAVPVTESYVRLLGDMIESGEVTVNPDDLKDSHLAVVYAVGGTRTAVKALLGSDPEALYYLSVQWADEGHTVTPAARLGILSAVREIRRALSLNPDGTPSAPATP